RLRCETDFLGQIADRDLVLQRRPRRLALEPQPPLLRFFGIVAQRRFGTELRAAHEGLEAGIEDGLQFLAGLGLACCCVCGACAGHRLLLLLRGADRRLTSAKPKTRQGTRATSDFYFSAIGLILAS